MNPDKEERHESYGLVGLSRVTSSHGVSLFGSDLKHRELVVLKVQRASVERHLHQDWIHSTADPSIVEVVLSEAQFAGLITTWNRGDGVPCTLDRVGGKKMADPPDRAKIETVKQEIRDHGSGITSRLREAKARLERVLDSKNTPTKTELRAINEELRMAIQEVVSDTPFLLEQAHEEIEKARTDAIAEIEAHMAATVQRMGMQAIAAPANLMIEKGTEDHDQNQD